MKLPLEAIIIGERRREDYGDIAALAESIKTYGLLHPIVVDQDGNLVAGERRLRAVEALGWGSVDVRDLGELSEAERAEIELEENLQRKDLTPVERSRTVVKLAETAKAVLQETSDVETFTTSAETSVPNSVQKPAHRPDRPGSLRDVAERIGVPPMTIVKAQQHVETAEQYPELQAPGWRQYHVLEAREKLEKLPKPDRPKAVDLVTQPGIPPRDGVEILNNLAKMPAEQRGRVFTLQESDDPRDRDLALTTAADLPPMPDPRIAILLEVVQALKRAEKAVPADEMTPRIATAKMEADSIMKELREGYDRDRRA